MSQLDTKVRPKAATTPKRASAVAAPSPDTNPASRPSKIVRRRHRMPTGPTGTAIMAPITMPFRKNTNGIWGHPSVNRITLREWPLGRNAAAYHGRKEGDDARLWAEVCTVKGTRGAKQT